MGQITIFKLKQTSEMYMSGATGAKAEFNIVCVRTSLNSSKNLKHLNFQYPDMLTMTLDHKLLTLGPFITHHCNHWKSKYLSTSRFA